MFGEDGADTFRTGLSNGRWGRHARKLGSRPRELRVAHRRASDHPEQRSQRRQVGEGDKVGKDIEEIVGTPLDDEVKGSRLDQHIWGLAGSDDLNGGNGDDVIEAGSDEDSSRATMATMSWSTRPGTTSTSAVLTETPSRPS